MTKSYENLFDSQKSSLAIERFMIAPYGVTWSPSGKLDFASPPTGFVDMGAVVEDTPSVKMSKSKFSLSLGLPKTLQFEVVTEVGAEIDFSIYSVTAFNAQFMLANTAMTTISSVTSVTTAVSYIGKSSTVYYSLLGIADMTSGAQIVHEFPKVTAAGDWEEQFRPEVPGQTKYTFKAMGYTTTIDSCTHLVVGKRYYFGPGGVCVL